MSVNCERSPVTTAARSCSTADAAGGSGAERAAARRRRFAAAQRAFSFPRKPGSFARLFAYDSRCRFRFRSRLHRGSVQYFWCHALYGSGCNLRPHLLQYLLRAAAVPIQHSFHLHTLLPSPSGRSSLNKMGKKEPKKTEETLFSRKAGNKNRKNEARKNPDRITCDRGRRKYRNRYTQSYRIWYILNLAVRGSPARRSSGSVRLSWTRLFVRKRRFLAQRRQGAKDGERNALTARTESGLFLQRRNYEPGAGPCSGS